MVKKITKEMISMIIIFCIVLCYGWKNHLVNEKAIIGIIVGMLYFFFSEGGKPGESFSSQCWVRKQNDLFRHNKVYIFFLIMMYINSRQTCGDLSTAIDYLLGAWVGLHFTQDMVERYHESDKKSL